MAWDPKVYLAVDEERTRPARELLARIEAENPAYVADLGCGPGNSTALLAARWTKADIEGIDNSAEMLTEAHKGKFRARWTQADVAQWNPDRIYDVIFSNATLQWVPDHLRLLPQLVSHLAVGGVLAFQMPRNFNEPSHTLIREVAQLERWRDRLATVRNLDVLEPEEYFDILEPHMSSIDIWETRYVQLLEGEDAVYRWTSGTGLRPFANALEGEEREVFLAEYRRRVALAYPRRPNGVTLFPFQRLFCVARRKSPS
jgi:trans-aconitate 2-methyltransferase